MKIIKLKINNKSAKIEDKILQEITDVLSKYPRTKYNISVKKPDVAIKNWYVYTTSIIKTKIFIDKKTNKHIAHARKDKNKWYLVIYPSKIPTKYFNSFEECKEYMRKYYE